MGESAADTRPQPRFAVQATQLEGESLADYATRILRDRLIVLDIAPGAPLNEEALGRELGIGRTPVREALKRLESEHLVSVYPRRGTFASTVDITDLAAISEIRSSLEPVAARRAARHAAPTARSEMLLLADSLASLDIARTSAADLMRFDLEVHRSIYAASGNRHLEEVLLTYDNLATRIWCLVIDRLSDVSSHITEHIDLLTKIAAGDADGASAQAFDHVTSFDRLVRSAL